MALIRLFGGKDYTQRLKHQLLASVGLLLVGAVGLVCYFWLVPGSGLTDFAQGFYIGAVLGITAGALITLARCAYLLKNPEARQRAKVKDLDERTQTITYKSFAIAGGVTFFTSAAALFVVLPFSVEAFWGVLGTMALFGVTFAVSNLILQRTM